MLIIIRNFADGKAKRKVNYELIAILVTVVIQALYVCYKLGQMSEKLLDLEKKQDKHNNLIERMVTVEQSIKSAHKRIDDLREAIDEHIR